MRRLAAAALVCGVVFLAASAAPPGRVRGRGSAVRDPSRGGEVRVRRATPAGGDRGVGRPARHLPLIDVKARTAGDALEGGCHALMHEVGRRFAREHHVTLSTLQGFIPRPKDLLGRLRDGPGDGRSPATAPTGRRLGSARDLPAPADALPLYTCVHGLGHALMRGFHGDLGLTVGACRKLRVYSADCAQGAFHDYWIASSRRRHGEAATGRDVAAVRLQRALLLRARCWYRYFLEQPGRPAPETPADVVRLRRPAAAAAVRPRRRRRGDDRRRRASPPSAGTFVPSMQRAASAAPRCRGLAGRPDAQRRLLCSCARFAPGPRRRRYSPRPDARDVTDGRFSCAAAERASSRAACTRGERRAGEALFTFS